MRENSEVEAFWEGKKNTNGVKLLGEGVKKEIERTKLEEQDEKCGEIEM